MSRFVSFLQSGSQRPVRRYRLRGVPLCRFRGRTARECRVDRLGQTGIRLLVVVRGKAGDGAELTRGQGIGLAVDVRDRLAVQYIDQFHAVVKVHRHANARFNGNIENVVSVPVVFVNVHNFPFPVSVFYIHNHYTTRGTVRQGKNEKCH